MTNLATNEQIKQAARMANEDQKELVEKFTLQKLQQEAREVIDALHKNRTVPISRKGFHEFVNHIIAKAYQAGKEAEREKAKCGIFHNLDFKPVKDN